MDGGDALTIFLVCAGVWYILVPERVRLAARDGAGPAIHAAAEQVRALARFVAPAVRWLAYDVIVGRPRVKTFEDEGDILSQYETDTVPGQAVVSPDTDAVRRDTSNRTSTDVVRDGFVPLSRRMSPAEILAILAVQRTDKGDYRYSANTIAALVGGTRADTLAQIKAIRGVAERTVADPIVDVAPDGRTVRASGRTKARQPA